MASHGIIGRRLLWLVLIGLLSLNLVVGAKIGRASCRERV